MQEICFLDAKSLTVQDNLIINSYIKVWTSITMNTLLYSLTKI